MLTLPLLAQCGVIDAYGDGGLPRKSQQTKAKESWQLTGAQYEVVVVVVVVPLQASAQ